MARYALQAELYGLTAGQRNQGAAAVANAFDAGRLVGESITDSNRVLRGQPLLFVEANFDSRTEGDRIFETARAWADGRSGDAANGVHSYVRLREVNSQGNLVEQLLAESPGWVTVSSTE